MIRTNVRTLDGVQHIHDDEVQRLSRFLGSSFKISSPDLKDRLVGYIRGNESSWLSCFSKLPDSWSDEKKFQAIGVLAAIIHPEKQVSVAFFQLAPAEALVPQDETSSPANQSFLMRLRTLCDTVLRTYLSKIADTAEKIKYLHVLYTAAADTTLRSMDTLKQFLDDIPRILNLVFQPCGNPRVLLDAQRWNIANYLRDFLQDRERSKSFHYDPGLWNADVAARYMRHLRTTCTDSKWDIRFNWRCPTF